MLCAYQGDYVGQSQHTRALAKKQSNEDVPGEKRHLQGYAAVLPLPHRAATGKKILNFIVGQPMGRPLFLIRPYKEDKPLRFQQVSGERLNEHEIGSLQAGLNWLLCSDVVIASPRHLQGLCDLNHLGDNWRNSVPQQPEFTDGGYVRKGMC